jgi:hypothetical protein
MAIVKSRSITASIARFIAGPARVPKSQLPTQIEYSGDADRKIYVEEVAVDGDGDAASASPLVHFRPAGFTVEFPEFVTEHQLPDGDGGTEPHRSIQWRTLGIYTAAAAACGGVGYSLLGIGAGVVGGALPFLLGSLSVTQPEAAFNPAATHATKVKAQRVVEEHDRAVFETFQELEEAYAEIDSEPLEKALDHLDNYRTRFNEQLDDIMGTSDRSDGSQSSSARSNGRSRSAEVGDD